MTGTQTGGMTVWTGGMTIWTGGRWLTDGSPRPHIGRYLLVIWRVSLTHPSSPLAHLLFPLLRHLINLCYPVPEMSIHSKIYGTNTAIVLFSLLCRYPPPRGEQLFRSGGVNKDKSGEVLARETRVHELEAFLSWLWSMHTFRAVLS